jgi:metallophosphoesterase superfamily enzyme
MPNPTPIELASRNARAAFEDPDIAPEQLSRSQSTRRWFAIGDPQFTVQRFFEILAREDLLSPDGWLRPDVGLVSLGDHFDFGPKGMEDTARREGGHILAWLASHAPEMVVVIAGNHDLARVQELATVDDEEFERARRAAAQLPGEGDSERRAAEDAFHEAFPWAVTPGLVARDYSAFTVRQRSFVKRLLVRRRLVLATSGVLESGVPVLMNHAGMTTRELELLEQFAPYDAVRIADRLNPELSRAVDRMASTGVLDLHPLHAAGEPRSEGGGLLYHRASIARPDAWTAGGRLRRRYDPRAALPRGLAQLVGHTGHKKLVDQDLAAIATDAARRVERGGLRTLQVSDAGAVYDMGIQAHTPDAATLYLVDCELAYAGLEACRVVPLQHVDVPAESVAAFAQPAV